MSSTISREIPRTVLSRMSGGQKGVIVEIAAGEQFKRRCLSMGLFPGRKIVKISHFALRGPVTLKVGATVMAVGHRAAEKIFVECA